MSFDTPTMTVGDLVLPGAPKKPAPTRTLSDATSGIEFKSAKVKTKSRPKLPLLPPLNDQQAKYEESEMSQENDDDGLGSPASLENRRQWPRQVMGSKRSRAPAPTKKCKAENAPVAPRGFEVETAEDTETDEDEQVPKTPPKKKKSRPSIDWEIADAVPRRTIHTDGVRVPFTSSTRALSMVARAVPVHPEDEKFVGVGYGKLGNYCTEVPAEIIFGEKFQGIVEEYAAKGQQVQLTYTCLDNKDRPVPGADNTKRKLVSFVASAARAYMEIQCLKLIKGNELRWPVTPVTAEKKKLRFYVSRIMAQRLLA